MSSDSQPNPFSGSQLTKWIQKPPLQDKLLFCSSDIDDMVERISDVIRPHHLQPTHRVPKDINARFYHESLTDTSVSYLVYGFPTKVEAEQLGDYMIEVPLSGSASSRCGKQQFDIKPGLGSVVSPGQLFTSEWSIDCSKLLFFINKSAVETQLTQLLGNDPRYPIDFDMAIDFSTDRGRSLLNILHLMVDELENPNSLLHSTPLAHRQYEQMAIWALLNAQPHNYSDKLCNHSAFGSPHHVRSVVDYIEKNCAEEIMLEDLIRVSGVGKRTLFAAFKRYKNSSPMKHLKNVRMDKVHQALRQTTPEETNVTQLAEHWGFSQLGRFSVEYRERYGESPSETLKRKPSLLVTP